VLEKYVADTVGACHLMLLLLQDVIKNLGQLCSGSDSLGIKDIVTLTFNPSMG
jgi:hypothetical protein